MLNECADQLATRGVAGDSYSEEIPVTPVPPEEPESTEEIEITDDANRGLVGHGRFATIRNGLAAEAQRVEQEEVIRRCKPSPASAILRPPWNSHRNRRLIFSQMNRVRARISPPPEHLRMNRTTMHS
jgi:hypothetical protein